MLSESTIRRFRPLARKLRRMNVFWYRLFQGAFRLVGLNVIRVSDFYSPLPVVSRLKKTQARWDRPSALAGIAYDLEEMKRALASLLDRYGAEYQALPPFRVTKHMGFGPGFTNVDALTAYAVIRQAKPRRYLEVGSGLSTYYASQAAARNMAEGAPLQITCIEPYPYEKLSTIPGIRLIQKEVQDVEVQVFQELEAGDILFIDSTHILKVDGDVPYLFLEVLPALRAGVRIHIHDVPFPYNIPYPADQWIFGMPWPMYWNEAMVVQAFLCHNDAFRITLSTPLIRHFDESFLRARIPGYESIREEPKTFCSLWVEKTR